MTAKEILEQYRSGELQIKMEIGSADPEAVRKLRLIERIVNESGFVNYAADMIDVIRMYYFDGLSAEEIAAAVYASPRTVYRRRDSGLKWLADHFDN